LLIFVLTHWLLEQIRFLLRERSNLRHKQHAADSDNLPIR